VADIGATQRSSSKFILFNKFEKMNTRLARHALPETQAAWMENLQPIGDNDLVPVPAAIAPLTTLASELVQSQYFANIGAVDYLIVFTVAGAGVAVNLATGQQTQFAPDGTFSAPDMTVYASARILIQDPTAGYSTWDGTTFVTFGGLSPNIIVTAGGSGYTSAPTVAITGGSGHGALAHAVIAGGAVVSVVLDAAGTGYKPGDTLTVAFAGGGGSAAAATVIVWPQQLGTTIAVFGGRVWWGNGHVLQYTGTAGYDDTNPANAAGSTTITDADLVHSIQALRNLNNYLYIFGDNSVRQIGSISVSGALTLFTPLILASDIGTSFKNTILSYNRLVVFANRNGVYAIFGASVEKISDDLDGIFGGASPVGANHSSIDFSLAPSAALQDLRNIHCYLLLVRYIDPLLGPRSIILAFQDRKWFVISQGNSLVAIVTAPLASTGQVETFASSGSDITQLLQDTGTAVPVTLKTALSPHQNPIQQKQPLRAGVGLVAQGTQTLTLGLESENSTMTYTLTAQSAVMWVNNALQTVTWLNNAMQVVTWVGRGYSLPYTAVDGSGKFLGATITSTIANCVINQVAIEYQDRALWGTSQ